jgi:hypothetical protein
VDDGLNIRWRQTAPDRGLVTLALAELQALHAQWPETVQCEIIIERAGQLGAEARGAAREQSRDAYQVSVKIDFGLIARARGEGVRAEATSAEIASALRSAFAQLRADDRVAAAA